MQRKTHLFVAGLAVAGLGASALGVTVFGLDHAAMGSASLSVTPAGLHVGNIGSSGQDGVEVDLGLSLHSKDWQCVVEGHAMGPAGESFTLRAIGTKGTGIPATAGVMTVVIAPGLSQVHFDFSGCDPAHLSAEYYFQGQLVAVEDGLPPGVPVLDLAFGGGTPVLPDLGFSAHWDNINKIYRFDGNLSTERTIGGATLEHCDAWIVTAEAPGEVFQALEAVEITALGVGEFTIIDESLEERVLGDVNADCVVDTADLGLLLGVFGNPAVVIDLNGDGVTDTADLGLLLGAFGDQCGE